MIIWQRTRVRRRKNLTKIVRMDPRRSRECAQRVHVRAERVSTRCQHPFTNMNIVGIVYPRST